MSVRVRWGPRNWLATLPAAPRLTAAWMNYAAPVVPPAQPPSSPPPHSSRPPITARRARPIYRVFVSSTWIDLQPERKALMEALHRMEEMRFVGMEFFGNRPDDTHDASIDQVDLCEVFVGMTSDRPHRRPVEKRDALRQIQQESGRSFDPKAVEALFRVIGPP